MPYVVERLPYPVALPVAIALGSNNGPSPQARLWNVHHAAYQVLRTAVLPVVAQYMDAPVATEDMPRRRSVESVAEALSQLRTPFFSGWIRAFEALARHVTPDRLGLDPCLPLARSVEALKSTAALPISESYGQPDEFGPAPAHRLLQWLRNGLAHGGSLPDDGACAELLDWYTPILRALVGAFDWLAECELFARPGEFDGSATRVRLLRGPVLGLPFALGDDEPLADALERGPVAMRVPDGSIVSLWPLFAATNTRLVGLYDGHHARTGETRRAGPDAGRHVVYLGAQAERWQDTVAADVFVERMNRRLVQWNLRPEHLSPWTLAQHLRAGSRLALADAALTGPAFARLVLDRAWEQFLTGVPALRPATPGANGLLLVGNAGVGKTTWINRAVVRLLGQDGAAGPDDGDLVLLLRGEWFTHPGDAGPRLLPTLLEWMGLRPGDFPSTAALFGHLAARWRDDTQPDRRFVLVIDGVDRAVAPERLLHEVADLVRVAASHPWCRVVVSVRAELLDVLRGKRGSQEPDPIEALRPFLFVAVAEPAPAARDHAQPSAGRPGGRAGAEPPFVRLDALADGEAEEAYLALHGAGGCTTAWSGLDLATRALLRTPAFLTIFHRVFRGAPAEPLTTRSEVLRRHLDDLFQTFGTLEEHCARVEAWLANAGATAVMEEGAAALRADWARGRAVSELRAELSPVESLSNAGLLTTVLRRDGGELRVSYTFPHAPVLDYLAWCAWKRESPALDRASLLVRAVAAPSLPPPWTSAFYFVFEELLASGRVDDWVELASASPVSVRAEAARAWLAHAVALGPFADVPFEQLLGTPPGAVVRACSQAGTAAANKVLHALAHALERQVASGWKWLVARVVREVAERLEDRGPLAEGRLTIAVVIEAQALHSIGRSGEAVESLRASLVRLADRVPDELLRVACGEWQLLRTLAVVLDDSGDPAALTTFEAARAGFVRACPGPLEPVLAVELWELDFSIAAARSYSRDAAGAVAAFRELRLRLEALLRDSPSAEDRERLYRLDRTEAIALERVGAIEEAAVRFTRAGRGFGDLVEERGDPKARFYAAIAEDSVGRSRAQRSDWPGALRAYEQAREGYVGLAAATGHSSYRWAVAGVDLRIADVLTHLGRSTDAAAAATRGRDGLACPSDPTRRAGLADAHGLVGTLSLDADDLTGALAAFEAEIALRRTLAAEELAEDGEHGDTHGVALARAAFNLGLTLGRRKDLVGAIAALDDAGAARLATADPARTSDLLRIERLAAHLLGELGRDATQRLVRLVRIRDLCTLASDTGDVPLRAAVDAEADLAEALRENNDLAGAVEAWGRAARLADGLPPEQLRLAIWVHQRLGAGLRKLGRPREAAEAYERAVATWRKETASFQDPNERGRLGELESWLGVAWAEAGQPERALAAFERARALGLLVDWNVGLVRLRMRDRAGAIAAFDAARREARRLVFDRGVTHTVPFLCEVLSMLLTLTGQDRDGRLGASVMEDVVRLGSMRDVAREHEGRIFALRRKAAASPLADAATRAALALHVGET